MLFTYGGPPLTDQFDSSEEMELTAQQISMLDKCIPKFRGADPDSREKIIMDTVELIKRNWLEDTAFDRDDVTNVCDLSSVLSHSQIFLAYSRISLRQNQTGRQECCV